MTLCADCRAPIELLALSAVRGQGALAVASGEYSVDLSALEDVLRQLNEVISNLGNTSSNARYQTYLPPGALGSADFAEANDLHLAHTEMKQHLEDIVAHIHGLMDEFGTKTKKTHGAYQDQEAEIKAALSGGGTA
ncbi:hypothetical protein [Streptomyces sp. V3I7]|uniref:hypothetical protein n=1 Tax=Streptomyces sp. V3I7 TaxID=3042278 RepID=UPI00278A2937|nr:hypothetical protein [Streptomyces sp. V3I7]MDQ0990932.1 hypothetical protein [Streptomyces sp. V3I7]